MPITREGAGGDHAAKITLQCYFRLYDKLAGMTGTAAQNLEKRARVYKLAVVCVPTNRPVIREVWPDPYLPHGRREVRCGRGGNRPTARSGQTDSGGHASPSVNPRSSSERLKALGIEHEVLNAKPKHLDARRKSWPWPANKARSTVATNMAGRVPISS